MQYQLNIYASNVHVISILVRTYRIGQINYFLSTAFLCLLMQIYDKSYLMMSVIGKKNFDH